MNQGSGKWADKKKARSRQRQIQAENYDRFFTEGQKRLAGQKQARWTMGNQSGK